MRELSRIELDLWDLYRPLDYLAPEECVEGKLYWGSGNTFEELAICAGRNKAGQVRFVGLYNERGMDVLRSELHKDHTDSAGCTFMPYLELPDQPPETSDKPALMYWLLDREIEVVYDRLAWLEAMPARLKHNGSWEVMHKNNVVKQSAMLRLRDEGFHLPLPLEIE